MRLTDDDSYFEQPRAKQRSKLESALAAVGRQPITWVMVAITANLLFMQPAKTDGANREIALGEIVFGQAGSFGSASGAPSNLASGTPSNLASGAPSNLASGTPSNLASGTPSNLASGLATSQVVQPISQAQRKLIEANSSAIYTSSMTPPNNQQTNQQNYQQGNARYRSSSDNHANTAGTVQPDDMSRALAYAYTSHSPKIATPANERGLQYQGQYQSRDYQLNQTGSQSNQPAQYVDRRQWRRPTSYSENYRENSLPSVEELRPSDSRKSSSKFFTRYFGSSNQKTEASLISQSGSANNLTNNSNHNLANNFTSGSFRVPSSTGERKNLQLDLFRLGFYNGDIDGVLGPESRDAIKKFQRLADLKPTGRLTTEFMRVLMTQGAQL